jgi:hypothetical protein
MVDSGGMSWRLSPLASLFGERLGIRGSLGSAGEHGSPFGGDGGADVEGGLVAGKLGVAYGDDCGAVINRCRCRAPVPVGPALKGARDGLGRKNVKRPPK